MPKLLTRPQLDAEIRELVGLRSLMTPSSLVCIECKTLKGVGATSCSCDGKVNRDPRDEPK